MRLDQALQAANLPLDAFEPEDKRFLVRLAMQMVHPEILSSVPKIAAIGGVCLDRILYWG